MSKQTKTIIGIIIVALIVILILPKSKSNEVVKIGEISALTGAWAKNGEELRNSINLAINKINSDGGILGKRVEVVIEDGKCDTQAALSAWNKLVSIDKVQFILGGSCSTESLAIAPLGPQAKVLTLANITSANTISNEGEWFFRNSPSNDYIATNAAHYMVKTLGYKNIGIISEIKEFPQTYTQTFIKTAEADGATVVFKEEFSPNTTDFRSILSKIKSKNVDVILVSTQSGETAGIISKQLSDLGIERVQAYNAGFNWSAFIKGSGGYRPGNFIVVTGYVDPSQQKMKEYTAAYNKAYNTDISFNLYYISAGYDMVYRLKSAMEKCDSTTNVECVRNVFKTATSYEGVAGTIQVSSEYSPQAAHMPLGRLFIDDGKISVKPLK